VSRIDWEAVHRQAATLDEADPLAIWRTHFYLLPGTVYLDGNSLGLQSQEAEASVQRVLTQWREAGIDGWRADDEPWFDLSERLASPLAKLVGAQPIEVIATGSTTVNLHQLLATFYRPVEGRTVLLVDELNFPSDLYAAMSHIALHGGDPARDLRVVRGREGVLAMDDIAQALRPDVAVALFSSVLYQSGQWLSTRRLADLAHASGALLGLDLSHAIGAVPHHLHDDAVDFAFWCHYKYLNGGPGSVAGLFVHERHFDRTPGLAGWWGSDKARQFDMSSAYHPAKGAAAWQIATPHLLSLAPLQGALALYEQAGLEPLRAKSLALTQWLMELVDHINDESSGRSGYAILTPRQASERGGHVAIRHPEAARIGKALKRRGIIPDFRPPDILRLAPVPLYTRFGDVAAAAQALAQIVESGEYSAFPEGRDVIA